jgi:subtilisin-like proprotein convertase family protein
MKMKRKMKSKGLLWMSLLLMMRTLSAQTFTGTGGPIQDYATTDYAMAVGGMNPGNLDTVNFGLEQVCVDLTHTWVSDIDMYLIAPDGTTVLLVSAQGGDGDDYHNTCFRGDASTSIVGQGAPFTGVFKPMGQLGLVNNGQDGNNDWILRIVDTYPADDGQVISWSLTFGNQPAGYFSISSSALPIFKINTNGQSIPDEPKITADMGVIWNGNGVRNQVNDPFNHYNGKIGIETRGASSAGFPKKSYSIELRDQSGAEVDHALCGYPPESDWVLSAQYTDKTLMRGIISFEMMRQMGWWAPRSRPVELFVDGAYMGVYILMERVKRDNNRIDIAGLSVNDNSGDDLTGGYIIKLDKNSGSSDPGWNSQYLPSTGGDSIYLSYYYPDAADITPQQSQYIKAYIDSFETSLIGPDYQHPDSGYQRYVDVERAAEAYIIQELTRSIDAYRKSFYLYKDKNSNGGGKIKFAPVWDYDLSFGNVDFCNGMQYGGWQVNFNYVCGGDYWLNPFWFERMRTDSTFKRYVRCRWNELRAGAFSNTALNQMIDSLYLVMEESQDWNFTVWPIMGQYVWPNYYIGQNYREEVDTLKWWLGKRLTWLDQNFPNESYDCSFIYAGLNDQQGGLSISMNTLFDDEIRIQTRAYAGAIEYRLFDVSGRELRRARTEIAQGGTIVIHDTGLLSSGSYVLQVISSKGMESRRLLRR